MYKSKSRALVLSAPPKKPVSDSAKKSPKRSPKRSPKTKKLDKTPKSELQKTIKYLNRIKKNIHAQIKEIARSTPKIKIDLLPDKETQSFFAKIHENALGSYIYEYTNLLEQHIIEYDPLYMMFAENLKERALFRYMIAKLNYLLATTSLSYQRLLYDHMKVIARSSKSRLIPEIKKLLKKQTVYKKTIMNQQNIINLVSQKIPIY